MSVPQASATEKVAPQFVNFCVAKAVRGTLLYCVASSVGNAQG